MSNLCADIAKDFVTEFERIMKKGDRPDNFDPQYLLHYANQFKKCKDFPREPEVVEIAIDYTVSHGSLGDFYKLSGKKWDIVATEVIE